MEVTNRKLKAYIIIYLLFTSELFGFYRNFKLFSSLGVNDFIYVMLIMLTLASFISSKKYTLPKPNSRNKLWIFYSFALITICNIVYSYYKHHQTITQVLSVSYLFFVIPLVGVYLYRMIKSSNDCDYVEDAIVKFATAVAVISLIQVLLHFVNIDILAAVNGERYLTARIQIGQQIQICGLFIAYTKMRTAPNNRKYQIITLLLVLSFIFAISTRGLWIYLTACLAFYEIQRRKKHVNYYVIALTVITIILIVYNMIDEEGAVAMLDSGDNHVLMRMRTMNLYFNQVVEDPLFGLGFIKPIEGTDSYDLVMGDWGRAFRGDVGLLGFVNTFGVVGLTWFIFIVRAMIVKLKVLMKLSNTLYAGPYLAYLFFAIVGSVTFSIFANSQLMMFPIMFVLLVKRTLYCQATTMNNSVMSIDEV